MNRYPKETREPEPAPPEIPSFYQQIKEAAGPDGLPKDFSLRKPPDGREGGLRFADGAKDGIAMYHFSIVPGDLGPLPEILELIAHGNPQAETRLEAFFGAENSPTMLCRVDGLQDWIIEHREGLDPGMLYLFSLRTLKESHHVECIKLALSILELLNTDRGESRDVISTLALNDEFTLFCSYVIRGWRDGNEEMFRLAKLVHGWGRIFLVRQLETATPAIKDWMLREAWRNNVLPAYSARQCAQEGGFLELLQRDTLTAEDFRLAQELMEALLEEGPVRNISVLEDGTAILREYLRHAKAHGVIDEAAQERLAELTQSEKESPTA